MLPASQACSYEMRAQKKDAAYATSFLFAHLRRFLVDFFFAEVFLFFGFVFVAFVAFFFFLAGMEEMGKRVT